MRPPPDLDCKDIPYRNFRVLWNVPNPYPHHFDGDHDGHRMRDLRPSKRTQTWPRPGSGSAVI
jgi:hypothetical protein